MNYAERIIRSTGCTYDEARAVEVELRRSLGHLEILQGLEGWRFDAHAGRAIEVVRSAVNAARGV